MCRHATCVLPPEPQSAPAARAFVARCYTEWDLQDVLAEAQLAVSELVTNAVLHANTPLTVSVSCADGTIELAVFDGDPRPPVVRPSRRQLLVDLDRVSGRPPTDERHPEWHIGSAGSVAAGRGLLLVQAMAAEWGVSQQSDGKAVWVRAPAPSGWPHAEGCPCAGSARATALASGHRAVHRTAQLSC